VTKVGRLQHFQVSYSESNEGLLAIARKALNEDRAANNIVADAVIATAAATQDQSNLRTGAAADTSNNNTPQEPATKDGTKSKENSEANEPSYSPTNEPSCFSEAEAECPIETEGHSPAIDTLQSNEFHEQRCELLKQHMSGHWVHYFSSCDNISNTVIQKDPSVEQIAFPMTDEMSNDASIRLMHFSEEMNWLQGKKTDFDGCRMQSTSDKGRGISYLSSIGNQCDGCNMLEFQPTFSYWSSANDEGKYNFMKNSPSVRLARCFAVKNQTVCFVGDSVDYQLYYGFKNNLHRAETLHKKKCGSSFLNISSTEYPAQYSTNGTMEDRKYRKRMEDGFWMLMNEVKETTVLFYDTHDEFRFRYLQHYWYAPWTYEDMNSCDVIMMSQALHYRPPDTDALFNDTMAATTYLNLANFTAAKRENEKTAANERLQFGGLPYQYILTRLMAIIMMF
jgi:hypothetical protein